jgi:N-methylhydantoinase A
MVSMLVHSTTVATNALLTRTGLARAALVTNEGFRDVLEIGRQRRPELYDLTARRPPPLVPRKGRFTVRCRIDRKGREFEPFDLKGASRVAKEVVDGGFESVAVCFLNSHLNPVHERLMKGVLLRTGFRGHLSVSTEVDNESREYERTSTTVVNAALSPGVSRYLDSLERSLKRMGYRCPLYVMNSDGGTSTLGFASTRPVVALESGPAAGVVAASRLARALSLPRVLTFDMGGTTAKAGTVIDGEPEHTSEFEAAGRTHSGRSVAGSGYPVRGSFIDLAEVSAGGGTVAWADEAGDLKVGPRSAGSVPGPASYGKGGTDPTVTDANLLLGRLGPSSLLGGEMSLFPTLAHRSFSALADRLGWSVEEAAKGVVRLVNGGMSKALSMVTRERGRDPRTFTMVAFGGAGPMHACDLADEMGVEKIMVPVHAGLFSAYGLTSGALRRTYVAPAPKARASLRRAFESLEEEARRDARDDEWGAVSFTRSVEARYRDQSHELLVAYNGNGSLERSFVLKHREMYGFSTRDAVEAVNLRLTMTAAGNEGVPLKSNWEGKPASSGPMRRAWVGGRDGKVKVFTREAMNPGDSGRGPCVIAEYDSTLVVNQGWRWTLEEFGTRLSR